MIVLIIAVLALLLTGVAVAVQTLWWLILPGVAAYVIACFLAAPMIESRRG